LLTAGFPCQPFSIAQEKRKGFQDTRGTLFYEICRIAKVKKPSFLLLENVKGLLSHDEGFTFQVILESLDELGYWCEWQVLNSEYFGVPQHRERVFIGGHLRDRRTKEIFPISKINQNFGEAEKSTQRERSRIRVAYSLGVGGSFKERNLIGIKIVQSDGKLVEKVRYSIPVEWERLQGFPDNWTRWLSDTQRYKCLGNAVTVNVIEYLGEKLKNCLVN